MACGDVAHFMPQHPGQLRLVVHQRDQLAGGVDIAAGGREGIVDRAVEKRDGERVGRARQPRFHRDPLAHAAHVIGGVALHRAAEFLQQLGMIFAPLLRLALRDRSVGGRDITPADASAADQAERERNGRNEYERLAADHAVFSPLSVACRARCMHPRELPAPTFRVAARFPVGPQASLPPPLQVPMARKRSARRSCR